MHTVHRIYGSLNEELFDVFIQYPMGAGMGSSVALVFPFFFLNINPHLLVVKTSTAGSWSIKVGLVLVRGSLLLSGLIFRGRESKTVH